jgi:hypothetical protein
MFLTSTSTESGAPTAAVSPLVVGDIGRRVVEEVTSTQRRAAERAIDNVLEDSFPASDPPSWNPGVARPEPSVLERVVEWTHREAALSSQHVPRAQRPAPG